MLQSRTVTPSSSTQYITPQSRYDALSQVTVQGDSNLVSFNIKSGVSIFGVGGSLSSTRYIGYYQYVLGNNLNTLSIPHSFGYRYINSIQMVYLLGTFPTNSNLMYYLLLEKYYIELKDITEFQTYCSYVDSNNQDQTGSGNSGLINWEYNQITFKSPQDDVVFGSNTTYNLYIIISETS